MTFPLIIFGIIASAIGGALVYILVKKAKEKKNNP